MKTMTCRQLGGACDKELKAKTFDEMAQMSQQHGKEMFVAGDAPHLKAMDKMKKLMGDPKAMQNWFDSKKKEFELLPEK